MNVHVYVGTLVCINRFPTTAEFGQVSPTFCVRREQVTYAEKKMRMVKSIEEKIEDIAKKQLDRFGVKYHIKTDNIKQILKNKNT